MLPPWLIPFVLERLKHFAIYFLIAAVFGLGYMQYKIFTHKFYEQGYAQCLKDHPPQTNYFATGATMVNTTSRVFKRAGIDIEIFRSQIKLGY